MNVSSLLACLQDTEYLKIYLGFIKLFLNLGDSYYFHGMTISCFSLRFLSKVVFCARPAGDRRPSLFLSRSLVFKVLYSLCHRAD